MNDDLQASSLLKAISRALGKSRADEAELLFQQLCDIKPDEAAKPMVPTFIAIQRGRTRDALHALYALPENQSIELKAMCLYVLGDPSWHGLAESVVNDPTQDPVARSVMARFLGRDLVPDDTEGDSSRI